MAWIDEGPMLSQPIRQWMEDVYSKHVAEEAENIVAASSPAKAGVKVRLPVILFLVLNKLFLGCFDPMKWYFT